MQSATVIAAVLFIVFIQDDGQQITAIKNCGQRIPKRNPLSAFNAFDANHFPWHAAIYHKDKEFVPQYKCGGTVIDSRSILTAAHCVCRYSRPMDAAKIAVALGRLNLGAVWESSSQWFQADQIIVHKNFSSIDFSNDIAVIRLSTDATLNNFVWPICLWKANGTELTEVIGSAGTVIGWGRTESAERSERLRQASMPVVTSLGCLVSNRDFVGSVLSETNFCAGSRNGTSICEGDSGGSMSFELNGLFYIRGIVSVTANIYNETTQQSVCDPTQFAIFTDVAKYLPWIDDQMTNECVKIVRCDYRDHGGRLGCRIFLHINHSERKCKIFFDAVPDTSVTALLIDGELAELPDLSDAINKFERLTILLLSGVKLEIVERTKIATFRRIQFLGLHINDISELVPDTFDDLKNISKLDLSSNGLKTIHRDIFRELHNLESIGLQYNQLEILPDGLFRNNQKLESIWLQRNKIIDLHPDIFRKLHNLTEIHLQYNQLEILRNGLFLDNQKLERIWLQWNRIQKIECNFYNLPELSYLYLSKNYCIDEDCDVKSFCGTASISEMHTKIRNNCDPMDAPLKISIF